MASLYLLLDSFESDSSFLFYFHSNIIHFLFQCTPWQYCRIYGLALSTSSVIAGLRGALLLVRSI